MPRDLLDSLRDDHRLLRAEAAELEAVLRKTPDTSEALRQRADPLVQLLQAHVTRADQVLAPFRHLIRMPSQRRAGQDHADSRTVLRDLQALVAGRWTVMSEEAATHLSCLIQELRESLDEEERELFPVIERPTRKSSSQPVAQATFHDH